MEILIGLGVVWMGVCLLVTALCVMAARGDGREVARPQRRWVPVQPGRGAERLDYGRARRRPPRAPIG